MCVSLTSGTPYVSLRVHRPKKQSLMAQILEYQWYVALRPYYLGLWALRVWFKTVGLFGHAWSESEDVRGINQARCAQSDCQESQQDPNMIQSKGNAHTNDHSKKTSRNVESSFPPLPERYLACIRTMIGRRSSPHLSYRGCSFLDTNCLRFSHASSRKEPSPEEHHSGHLLHSGHMLEGRSCTKVRDNKECHASS